MNPRERSIYPYKWIGEALSLEEQYPCPVCRHGQIESLFMVDAFSCGFCRHIFTVEGQHLRLEDNLQSFKWLWDGVRWKSLRPDVSSGWQLVTWVISIAFVTVPTTIVWLAYHTFPPLPGQNGATFPVIWIGLVFIAHLSIVSWFYVEYFQVPLYVTARLYWQRFITQMLDA